MDILQFFLTVVPFGVNKHHIWSFIVYGLFCIFMFIKIYRGTGKKLDSFMVAFILCFMTVAFYEMIWGYFTYKFFVTYNVLGLIGGLGALQAYGGTKNLKFSWLSVVLLSMMIATTLMMKEQNFYVDVLIWIKNGYSGYDPHNWLWVINKGLGATILYPMIKTKKII